MDSPTVRNGHRQILTRISQLPVKDVKVTNRTLDRETVLGLCGSGLPHNAPGLVLILQQLLKSLLLIGFSRIATALGLSKSLIGSITVFYRVQGLLINLTPLNPRSNPST